jgi:hypothetical protein
MFIWSSTCFGRHTAQHQELKTALAASGFAYVRGCWTLRLLDPDSVQQPQRLTTFHVCKTTDCYCSFELLIMGGVSPETCWTSYKHRIIKSDRLLHLVGFFTNFKVMTNGCIEKTPIYCRNRLKTPRPFSMLSQVVWIMDSGSSSRSTEVCSSQRWFASLITTICFIALPIHRYNDQLLPLFRQLLLIPSRIR